MIEIKRRSDDGSYGTAGALLVVKHVVSKTDIVALIEAYKAEFGDSAAKALFETAFAGSHEMQDGPYFCFVENAAPPKVEHTSWVGALTEARRLATVTGKTTHVMRRVARVVPTTTCEVFK